ncbi:metal-dependent hydrolase family protein [Kribbella jiaozuonensis]|uniref:Amidohydrolase family protein n=1 Tax=Kribbella jiaozuonensis TaxID=2575441 RepID=A0A4V5UXQ4_9ACTN|nr:amidohydrolase family protein [Kribbella jiaozuonensis]TKK81813.1 amidohydrolase family protein [Kribbella jiaozuonensis]
MTRVALQAARIFDGERLLDENVVLVDDGKIVGLAREVPADWLVRSLPGATILPGLIDAHVHLTADAGLGALDRLATTPAEAATPTYAAAIATTIEQSLRIHLAAGVTTVRDLGDPRDAVLRWRRSAAPDLPTVVASGAPLTSVGGHCWALGGEVSGAAEMRTAVQARAANGADVIKIMASGGVLTPGSDTMSAQFTLEELKAATDEAHEQGLPITAHAHALAAVRQALAAGVDGIEHCTCLTPQGASVEVELGRAIAAAGIAVCSTLGSDRSIVVPPAVLEMVAKAGIGEAILQEAVRRLYDAGVKLVGGSDGGIGPAKPHGLLPATLAEYVEAGIPPIAALTAGTSAAADALRVEKGRIRAGADADLLVVAGDPTEDITTLAAPTAVYLGGEDVTPDASAGR